MTRTEFDQQIRELKSKRNAAVSEIAALQSEIKEEIAAKNRTIQEFTRERFRNSSNPCKATTSAESPSITSGTQRLMRLSRRTSRVPQAISQRPVRLILSMSYAGVAIWVSYKRMVLLRARVSFTT